MAESAKRVYAFDIDADLKPVLEETLAGLENVEVIFRDFHKLDLKEFEKEIGAYRVVANLPYYITTPLIAKLLDESELCEGVSVMVQEEVAERFCAKENTPEYGAITAGIALKGTAKIVKRVPRTLFYPRPNVDSAVVKIEFERDRLPVKDRKMYRDTVRWRLFEPPQDPPKQSDDQFFPFPRAGERGASKGGRRRKSARGNAFSGKVGGAFGHFVGIRRRAGRKADGR